MCGFGEYEFTCEHGFFKIKICKLNAKRGSLDYWWFQYYYDRYSNNMKLDLEDIKNTLGPLAKKCPLSDEFLGMGYDYNYGCGGPLPYQKCNLKRCGVWQVSSGDAPLGDPIHTQEVKDIMKDYVKEYEDYLKEL